MEYPIGDANTALMSQLKQNEILSTQDAADKALAELEAEINKRKNNQWSQVFPLPLKTKARYSWLAVLRFALHF